MSDSVRTYSRTGQAKTTAIKMKVQVDLTWSLNSDRGTGMDTGMGMGIGTGVVMAGRKAGQPGSGGKLAPILFPVMLNNIRAAALQSFAVLNIM